MQSIWCNVERMQSVRSVGCGGRTHRCVYSIRSMAGPNFKRVQSVHYFLDECNITDVSLPFTYHYSTVPPVVNHMNE